MEEKNYFEIVDDTFESIFSNTFKFWWKEIKNWLPWWFAFAGIFVIIGLVFLLGNLNDLIDYYKEIALYPEDFDFNELLLIFFKKSMIAAYVFLGLGTFASSVYVYSFVQAYRNNEANFSGIMRYFGNYFLKVLYFAVVLAIIYILIGVVSIILLEIPLIILATFWALTFVAGLYEDLGLFKAMSRSWQLVKNKFWKTFGLLALIGFMVGIANNTLGLFNATNVYVMFFMRIIFFILNTITVFLKIFIYYGYKNAEELAKTSEE